jgi:hypothetical protein
MTPREVVPRIRAPIVSVDSAAARAPLWSGHDAAARSLATSCVRGRRVAALLLMVACTTYVPPSTRVVGTIDLMGEPLILVESNRETDRIEASLRRAGLGVSSSIREANLVLDVKASEARLSKQCGGLRNVLYRLRQRGDMVLYVKARGYTGACEPNTFDAMSAELAAALQ